MLRRPTMEALSIGVGHGSSSGRSSAEPSPISNASPATPTKLSESGKFVIAGYEITREGVTAASAALAPAALPPSARGDDLDSLPEESEPTGVFAQLQALEIIGRGASGFVRRAVHRDGQAVAIKDICISDPSRRKQIFNEISLLRAQNPHEARTTPAV
eukprot:2997129-Prymnesium_polylepis.1